MGSYAGFSRSAAGRTWTLLAFAALAIALSLPVAASAKVSPPGEHQKSGKHPGPADRGPTAQRQTADAPAPTIANGDSSAVTALSFPAVKVAGGVATFRLKGISPERIRSAYVKRGHNKRLLSLRRIRAAARRGVLHVHVGKRSSHRGHKASISRHRWKKTTLIVVTDPPPAPAPEPAPAPTSQPAPTAGWRAVGSLPLTDAAAKTLVVPHAEVRAANFVANHYLPTASEIAAFHAAGSFNSLEQYVTGGFTGTTDEILQWGAQKWGIPPDVLRAVAVTESYWRQDQLGDQRDGVNASLYPALSRIDADSVYESLGITQVKWRPDGSLHPGTEPLRWKSTAFNVDYWGATIRYYYDGLCGWCGSGYGTGQAWESIGAWYSPNPWRNAGMLDYIAKVQSHLAERTWEQPGF